MREFLVLKFKINAKFKYNFLEIDFGQYKNFPVVHFKFVWNSIFDISFNFLKSKNEDWNCLKKYANLKKYLKIWTRISLGGIFDQSGFLLFCKRMAQPCYQILFPTSDAKVFEKFTFKFFTSFLENFDYSINHTSIPCTIPEISYQWLVPNVLISKNPPKMFRYCSKK